jgi:HD-like signal output (HDOD) protein
MSSTRSGATSPPDLRGGTPDASINKAAILKAASMSGVMGAGTGGAPRLLAALCDSEISAAEVARLIGQDPALSLRVLRVANSAYYGRSRSIGSIDRALSLLGLDSVRGIAAAACLDRVLTVGAGTASADLRGMMHHSRATATAAEALAHIRHPARATDAFITGLLHNVGTIVQFHLDAPVACDIIGHEECAAVIFTAWNLPEQLIVATRHHHRPLAAPQTHRDLATLVHLGASLALTAGYTFALEPASMALDPAAIAQLGLEDDQIAAVAAALPERVAALDQALFNT